MVTEHSNTVYDCATCSRPVYFRAGSWHHVGVSAHCTGLVLTEVRLPVPVREPQSALVPAYRAR